MNARSLSAIAPVMAAAAIAAEYQQVPGHFGGFSSAGTPITVADDFRFAEGMLVNRIVWWGGYFNPPATEPDNFTIRVFADDTGHPGALLITIAAGAVDRVATGQYVNPGLYPEFQYARQQRDIITAAARSDCGKPGNPPVARENGKDKGHRMSIAPSPSRRLPVRR